MKRAVLPFAPFLALLVASSCSQGEQQRTINNASGGAGATGATSATGAASAIGGSGQACPIAGQQLCGTQCVDVTTNASHCGVCNNACSPGQNCVGSQCTCPSGELCSGVCVDTSMDINNCGTCGTACTGGKTCQQGLCACMAGSTDCSGTCVDLMSDGSHCGDCTIACSADQVCSSGVCGTQCTVAGETPCSGSCVNLQTSSTNCGTCGNACAAAQTCVSGLCTCPGGGTLCGSACVDTSSDATHCGDCTTVCTGGRSCQASSCVCPSGQEFCDPQCTDTQTDGANCGSCGNACGAGESCTAGDCVGGGTGGAGTGGGSPVGGGGTTGGGGSGTGGGPTGIDPGVFAPDLDGFYWEGTCDGTASDDRQCEILNENGSCNNNVVRDITMSVHGDAGTAYKMEVEVRGLLGSRCYTGGTRRAGNEPVNWTGPNDGLYIGGTVPDNWWNTYEVHVQNGPPNADSTFYLNCYYDNPSPTIDFDPDTCTMEEVLEVGYTFDIPVMGNSSITFRLNDQNCMAQMNCGAYHDVKVCESPRTVDLSGMDPPATFDQPVINAVGGATLYPQWAYFDVKSVTEM